MSTTLVAVAATRGDDAAHERNREADDRSSLHEVTSLDLALCVGLDEIQFDRVCRAPCSVETLPIHCAPP